MKANDPAFPILGDSKSCIGFSKRDYIAIEAMKAYITNGNLNNYVGLYSDIAKESYLMADEMIKQSVEQI